MVVLGRFFSFGRQKKWLLVVLDKLSSYRGGPLNKFDYIYVYIFKGVVGALGGGGVILTI